LASIAPPADETVYVLDDDAGVRAAVTNLLGAYGFVVQAFASARDYLDDPRDASIACLVLDLALPDVHGLDLQEQLLEQQCPPIVVITGRGDIPQTVRAMKAGALEVLTKPVDPEALLGAVRTALASDRAARQRRHALSEVQARFARLTPRERQVLELVVSGLRNKQAAAVLGISEVTLQVHRGQIMRKTAARSFAELVRMATIAGFDSVPAAVIADPDGASSATPRVQRLP
jgi:FixJ family two-component response regulator